MSVSLTGDSASQEVSFRILTLEFRYRTVFHLDRLKRMRGKSPETYKTLYGKGEGGREVGLHTLRKQVEIRDC